MLGSKSVNCMLLLFVTFGHRAAGEATNFSVLGDAEVLAIGFDEGEGVTIVEHPLQDVQISKLSSYRTEVEVFVTVIDSRRLLLVDSLGTEAGIWNWREDRKLSSLNEIDTTVDACKMLNDGRIAIASGEGQVIGWDLRAGKKVYQMRIASQRSPTKVTASPQYILGCVNQWGVQLFNNRDTHPPVASRVLEQTNAYMYDKPQISPNSRYAAVSVVSFFVRVWDLPESHHFDYVGHEDIACFVFSPTSDTIVFGTHEGTLEFLDIKSRVTDTVRLFEPEPGVSSSVNDLAYLVLQGKNTVFALSGTGDVFVWDVDAKRLRSKFVTRQ